jgi:hypothetical protein
VNEKKRFSHQKTAINLSVQMDNSICHNGHRVVDELRRLKILRAPHPLYSSDISPCDVWIFGDFKAKLKDSHLQGVEEILTAFQKLWDIITYQEFQIAFQSWRDRLRWVVEHNGECFRKRYICNSAISGTNKNRGTFSVFFVYPVFAQQEGIVSIFHRTERETLRSDIKSSQ